MATKKSRIYTFGQLDSILHKRGKADGIFYYEARLRGNVFAQAGIGEWVIRISYKGKSEEVQLATVYRSADNNTLYVVRPPSRSQRAISVRDQRTLKVWQKYVPLFTPYKARDKSPRTCYLLRDGTATKFDLAFSQAIPLGVWLAMPSCNRPSPKQWAEFPQYENFGRRCRLFASRLRTELADLPPCIVQLLWPREASMRSSEFVSGGVSATLHICTPPTQTQMSKRLVVQVRMHDQESRTFHHVDGDFGIKHCQFIAREPDARRGDRLRWRCGRDAIAGIKEWVLGSLYIPGL